jgi:hypothetical protein
MVPNGGNALQIAVRNDVFWMAWLILLVSITEEWPAPRRIYVLLAETDPARSCPGMILLSIQPRKRFRLEYFCLLKSASHPTSALLA